MAADHPVQTLGGVPVTGLLGPAQLEEIDRHQLDLHEVGALVEHKVLVELPDDGFEKGAFLHVSDLHPDPDALELDDDDDGRNRSRRDSAKRVPIEDQLKKGDEVVTTGGIIGTVIHAQDDRLTIKTGENTRIVVERGRIARVWSEAETRP